jgi:hypothetical protein
MSKLEKMIQIRAEAKTNQDNYLQRLNEYAEVDDD